MAEPFQIQVQHGILVIRVEGTLSADETRQLVEKTRADTPDRALPRLWDLTRAEAEMTAEQIRRLADLAQREEHSPRRIAFVVSSDLAFGQTRIFGVYRETASTEVQVYRDEQSARRWLLGGAGGQR